MPQITLDLPTDLIRLADNFKSYYSSKQNNRKLTFNHYHSSAILTANYKANYQSGKPRSHELQVRMAVSAARHYWTYSGSTFSVLYITLVQRKRSSRLF